DDMAALHAGEVAAGAILLENEIAMAMWAGFEQQHGGLRSVRIAPSFQETAISMCGHLLRHERRAVCGKIAWWQHNEWHGGVIDQLAPPPPKKQPRSAGPPVRAEDDEPNGLAGEQRRQLSLRWSGENQRSRAQTSVPDTGGGVLQVAFRFLPVRQRIIADRRV